MENNYILTPNGELYHYGVLGMKWGIRKAAKSGGSYKYKSLSTKKWEKRASKYEAKSKEAADAEKASKYASKAKRASKIAKRSAQHDSEMQSMAKKANTGGVIATNVLLGPWGDKTYRSVQASGGSKGAAVTATILSSAIGLGPITAAVTKSAYIRDVD